MKEQFLKVIEAKKNYIEAIEKIEEETNIRIADGILNTVLLACGIMEISKEFGCALTFKERNCEDFPFEASFFFDDFEIIQLLEVK